jgi:hypothetical protein
VSYGFSGADKKMKQSKQDDNAQTLNEAVMVERAVAKGSTYYWNGDWDLVDAVAADSTVLIKLKAEDRTDELKGKTDEEIKTLVEEKTKERQRVQKEIAELNEKRLSYIDAQTKNSNSKPDDFGTAVAKSIRKNAVQLGFDEAKKNE